jgi:hypothetical protein
MQARTMVTQIGVTIHLNLAEVATTIAAATAITTITSRLVFKLLQTHRFYLKLSKCSFMENWTLFLGYYVGPEGIKPDPSKVNAVKNWPTPTTVTEVRAFLALCNFFKRFVQGFTALALPLQNLT